MEQPKRLLVIGIGNPSRTDDGAGHYVVDRLESWLAENPRPGGDTLPAGAFSVVDTDHVHQLTPELSDTIKDYDAVVFVDASVGGAAETVILAPVLPARTQSATTHHWSPEGLLALTAELFGRTPRAYLLSIVGRDFNFGEDLSPITKADAGLAVARLIEFTSRGLPSS